MNSTKTPQGTESGVHPHGSEKCKISIDKKLKGGTTEHRHTSALSKATAFLRRETFEQVTVRTQFAWISNEGTFDTLEDALHFLKNNWADFLIWKEEVV